MVHQRALGGSFLVAVLVAVLLGKWRYPVLHNAAIKSAITAMNERLMPHCATSCDLLQKLLNCDS